jgi:replication-associated recombination protein RarA
MSLTGLEDIKRVFLEIFDTVTLDNQRGIDSKKKRYNVRLEGNPGTGKTTVARLYAKLLKDLNVIPAASIKETSGSKLVDGGVPELKKLLDEIDKAGGGVLFVDEAYQLDPVGDRQGKQVLNYFLDEMENKIGKLVVAFAGYTKDMEKLFEFNTGLPSRFPFKFVFQDYSDEELLSIFLGTMKKSSGNQPFYFKNNDPKYARIAIKRLSKMRGSVGFGNARAVSNLFETVQRRQSARIREMQNDMRPGVDLFCFERDDLLGPPVDDIEKTCKAWQELDQMTGLTSVKQTIKNLFELVKTNAVLEEQEKPQRAIALNRLFLGNPGTGKTTVAALYARILADLGLLSKGEVVLKTASDFVGSVLGASEEATKKIIASATGR